VEFTPNTLQSEFKSVFKSELVNPGISPGITELYAIYVRSGTANLGVASIDSSDISVDTASNVMTLIKSVTISSSGTADNILITFMRQIDTSPSIYNLTVVSLPSPVSVAVNDVVTVQYTLKLYLAVSNPGGLLSDATPDSSGLALRIYDKFRGATTATITIARVEYIDVNGNVVLSVATSNDTSNYIIVAPATSVTTSFDLAKIVFKASDGTVMVVWTKATPQTVPAGSYLATRVAVTT
jgi:hypothetical protein